MAKYYSAVGSRLYLLVSGGDEIDLNIFPQGIKLFDAGSSWRITPWAAVTEDASERSLKVADILLPLEGYTRIDVEEELLEEYLVLGEESRLVHSQFILPKKRIRTRRRKTPVITLPNQPTVSP